MTNPIEKNPGIPPIQPTHPGEVQEGEEQRPFSLGPDGPAPKEPTQTQDKPSPMDLAREGSKNPQWTPEELGGNISNLQDTLASAQNKLQNPGSLKNFTQDHYTALGMVVDKMNPDMHTIAKNSEGEFSPPLQQPDRSDSKGMLSYITQWLNGSQETLSNALNYVQNVKNPNPASYLKLQYAVQRATQRGELFASIIGSSVSGIKTIMSTQLG